MHNLLRISRLFDQQSSSVRNGLKVTLSRDSQFKLHFSLGMTEKSRIAPKFPRHLSFEELLINNTELQDISIRINA